MDEMDWNAVVPRLTAEELTAAMDRLSIDFLGCGHSGDDDREISIAFGSITAAEQLMTAGVPYSPVPGGFYDRAVAGCVSLTEMGSRDKEPADDEVDAAIDRSWLWTIHPEMSGERFGWHVAVDMSLADAQQLTINLNAARLAGEL